jgi:hypothetical protein
LVSLSEINPDKVVYPPTDSLEVVIGHFHEVGRVGYSGMGITPVTWSEMASWMASLSFSLPNWEILAIREMSMAYVGEYNQASDPNREAPYNIAEIQITNREKVAQDLKAAFNAFKRT